MQSDYPRAHYVDQAWPQTQRHLPAGAGTEDVFNYTQPAPKFLELSGKWSVGSHTTQILPPNRLLLEKHRATETLALRAAVGFKP